MSGRMVTLSDIAEVRVGRQRSPKNHIGADMRKYLRAANVSWDGLKLDDVKSMNFDAKEMELYHLQRGDILLSEASGSPKEVGKPAIWNDEIQNCAFQNTLIRVRPHSVEPRYLLHYFHQQASDGAFARGSRGVGIHHLGQATLSRWQVPLPAVDEQQRIAEILDIGDRQRVARRHALALLDALAQSIFLELFGDLSKRTTRWNRVRMGSFLAAIESGSSPTCLNRAASPTELGVLKLGAVTRCVYMQDENKAIPPGTGVDDRDLVRPGDLLFSRKNTPDLVAASAYVRQTRPGLLLPDLIFRLVPRDDARVDKVYLHGLLTFPAKRKELQQLASGSAASMSNISKAKLLDFECEIPPLDLQLLYASRIDALENALRNHQAHLTQLDALFASLQHRAFRGELFDSPAA